VGSIDWTQWQEALASARGEEAGSALPPWLAQAEPAALDASHIEVRIPEAAPSGEATGALRATLERALERTIGRHVQVLFRGPPAPGEASAGPAPAGWPARFLAQDRPRLNPQYTFENFVTGPCNRMAHAAALAVSDLPGGAYNPLFIHSSVGLGKSHLIQAVCHEALRRRPEVRILYVSCEDFVNQFITAIERGQIDDFRYKFRHVDVLLIDDIHFLADKDRTQEEFFHTFNTLYQAQKQVVLSSDSPPHEIPRLEERLVSRFKWGLVVRIDRPSYETRVAIVQKKSRLRGVDLPDDVIHYIASAVDSNNRELEGAVIRVLGYASLSRRLPDLDLTKEALRDLVTAPHQPITIQDVTNAVLQRYNARLADLQGRRQTQSITLPRQICMYLARRLTNHSLGEIGTFFGGRDHTTVLYAEDKIAQRIERDAAFRGLVEAIERDVVRT